MQQISRRAFAQNMLGSLLTFSLVKTLCRGELLTGSVKPIAGQWLMEMEQVSKALKAGSVKPVEWQQKIEELLARVELSDLLRSIDYNRLAKTALFPEDHESAQSIDFSQAEGLPAELSFVPFFYAMKKGAAIAPHGHRNMTSMHMILDGRVHDRHYERLADEPRHLIIRPTTDKMPTRGDLSTISDQKNNIHWFKALTGTVFMFSIAVFNIDPAAGFTGREYIDPMGGEKLDGGLIRARRVGYKEARKLYGKSPTDRL